MHEVFVPLLTALVTAVAGTIGAWILARVRSGRSVRSLEQGTKLIEFLGQYCQCYSSLDKLTEVARTETEQLLLEIVQAIREDFGAECALLPQFEQDSTSLRHTLLLYSPRHSIMWLPRIVFFALLLFVPYVIIIRAAQGRWTWGDTFAILLSCLLAVSVRLVVRLVSPNEGH